MRLTPPYADPRFCNFDGGLTVCGSRERLRLLGGDGHVAGDELGHDPAEGFDTEGEESDVKQKNIANAPRQDGALDSRTDGNGLVRVNTLVGLTTEDVLDRLDDLGHTGHTANKNDLLDVARLQASSDISKPVEI